MNHHVPEFDVDEFHSAPSSRPSRQKNMEENEIMELVWHNGQPGIQNRTFFRKPSPPTQSQQHPQSPSHQMEQPPEIASTTQLFMQEDEMTSWLHYPLDDGTSFDQHLNDLLYHPPGPLTAPPSSSARELPPADFRPPPPVPQPHHQDLHPQTRPQFRPPAHPSAAGINFPQFARLKSRVPESGQSASSRINELRESTVVDSSDTPKSSLLPVSRSAVNVAGGESISGRDTVAGISTGGDRGGYMTMNKDVNPYGGSFSGGSATATADLMARPPADDRKRRGVESADTSNTDYGSEDLETESYEAKKQCRGTAFGKRSRAAEVHNLSERKRRDRINEKMKALQELIPRCSKTDKASMLDEAIKYLKLLQMQVQMMSMGYYGMVPMMFPGVQQYMQMPPMGMGMGMGTGMNRPMMPFLTGSSMSTPVPPSPMDPRYQFPAFPMPPVSSFDPSRVESHPMEPVFNPHDPQCANLYQHYLGGQQMPAHQIPQEIRCLVLAKQVQALMQKIMITTQAVLIWDTRAATEGFIIPGLAKGIILSSYMNPSSD
ncbi:hypothetical protein V2J09_016837 [Rumex salicifolius]